MTIKFKLRRPEDTQTSLFVEFKKNGQKIVLFPGKSVLTEHWHSGNQVCKKNHPQAAELNSFLKTWKDDLEKIVLNLETQKEFISKERIQAEFEKLKPVDQSETESKDFIGFMSEYIAGKKIKKREVQKLQQTRKLVILTCNLITKKRLAEWESLSIAGKSKSELNADYKLKFEDIDHKFIEKFRDYLYTAQYERMEKDVPVMKNYKRNYIDRTVKGLKQFIRAAFDAKLVQYFTWNDIKSEAVEVDTVYTDFKEIQAIADTHLTSATEILVQDKYVLNCYMALRYVDLNKLEPHLFTIDNEFVQYSGRAQKTGKLVTFDLDPVAIRILEKYNYNLPKLNLAEFNETIKVVAKKAGLTNLVRITEVRGYEKIERDVPKYQLMGSHTCRRSLCTNLFLAGVPIKDIMNQSGHVTEKEFRKYIKKTDADIKRGSIFPKGHNRSGLQKAA